ncbi:hypothetical protein B5F29_06170 [Lachnoclostridium sp. An196]|uniref:ComEA family DNA-binding protein n=1 Tax=Lachnoclostridium sp. An196 TaxID=1965583 RepID=UPI000B38153F|nr:helix-hairpin-helix domain-containing protein [Lachnoclostridium sp. An196]OUP20246.1 hypothetical protein B5F29_06170 [Lachnoclostridium sp. An196]HIS06307.1 helix-hairpin-helix domain-containing protein [Candidatus Choladocola avistercoris]
MKIKFGKNVFFGILTGAVCAALAGCGMSFCGFSLQDKDEMVFACEEYDSTRPELSDGDADGTLSSQEQDEGNLSGAGTDTQPEKESRAEELIDINAAGAEELMTLNGIGETRAAAIIEFREQNGPFVSIEEIMLIPGIKEGIFSKIQDQIVVR